MQRGSWGTQKPPVGSVVNWGHPRTQGLVGCWMMNEDAGGFIRDIARRNDGTLTGFNYTSASGWVPGKQGPSLIFDGTNDYAALPASSVLNLTGNLSILTWIKSTSTSVTVIYGGYNHAGGDVGCGLGYSILAAGKIAFYSSGVAVWRGASTAINDGLWHRVGAVLNGTTVTFYLDGHADGTGVSAAGGSNTGVRAIGAASTGSTPFPGSLDSMFLWGRALTPTEVLQDFSDPYAMIQPPPATKFYSYAAVIATGNRRRRILCAGSTM